MILPPWIRRQILKSREEFTHSAPAGAEIGDTDPNGDIGVLRLGQVRILSEVRFRLLQ